MKKISEVALTFLFADQAILQLRTIQCSVYLSQDITKVISPLLCYFQTEAETNRQSIVPGPVSELTLKFPHRQFRILGRSVRENHDKLITAVSRNDIGLPEARLCHIGKTLENFVTRFMPELIVDCFEIVKIGEYKNDGNMCPLVEE